jgi:hypothetical protein
MVIALKMIEMLEGASRAQSSPISWRMRSGTFKNLKRQSRHTGDVRMANGVQTFIGVPIEISKTLNSLGVELVTAP